MHPIILGSLFLAIVECHIDVKYGKLSFDVGDEHMEFNLFKASKFPSISDQRHRNLGWEIITNHVSNDPLKHCMLNYSTTSDKNPE